VLASFVVVAAASCGARPPAVAPLVAAAPRFVGRFDFSDPEGPRFAWSASRIEAAFRGTGIAMRLRAEPLEPHTVKIDGKAVTLHETVTAYTIEVDGGAPFVVHVGGGDRRYVLARGLDRSRFHTVAITRDAEAFAGVHQLLGLDVEGGALAPLPRREDRLRIEIVGDSITCGYGVLGVSASCPFTYATERASMAYGALVGRALDADVTTLCWSGRGVYRNYDIDGEPTMPELFELAVPVPKARPTRWSFASAKEPDALVVHLGGNDFFADGDHDGKPEPIDHAAFHAAFVRFLGRVREVYPRAPVFVALAPMLKGTMRDDARASLARVVDARRAAGDAGAFLLELEEQGDRVGCDSHPNAAMHRVTAAEVEAAIRAKLGRR